MSYATFYEKLASIKEINFKFVIIIINNTKFFKIIETWNKYESY